MMATLKKLSICDCGFPSLKDEIGIGSAYTIDSNKLAVFVYKCGQCGKEQKQVVCVLVGDREGAQDSPKPGYLPRDLFLPFNRDEQVGFAADQIASMFPNDGFILFVAPKCGSPEEAEKDDKKTDYISNVRREDAIKMLKNVLFRWGINEEWMERAV